MKAYWIFFPVVALLAVFTGGCDLSGGGSSSGSPGAPPAAALRARYAGLVSYDPVSRVAVLSDGLRVYVTEGTFQRASCSWENDFLGAEDQFEENVRPGQLVFYRVRIVEGEYDPLGDPLVTEQFTVVNVPDCYSQNPCTCGCEA